MKRLAGSTLIAAILALSSTASMAASPTYLAQNTTAKVSLKAGSITCNFEVSHGNVYAAAYAKGRVASQSTNAYCSIISMVHATKTGKPVNGPAAGSTSSDWAQSTVTWSTLKSSTMTLNAHDNFNGSDVTKTIEYTPFR